ncbi:hypothetical protein I6F35_16485 [Bradyrhizobium sp. BRP22]|uniref:hypothetical protein n=1 Tax=Bradyrhizobium sp. BRP22 TaxID=2793821 RepID=UPI001CD638C2|nr:hypothetical protein [Bradyrhizobium sp. BRP22]MCA1454807.1 hypothetical protein [Bradyrhizobium sp. BRP22]
MSGSAAKPAAGASAKPAIIAASARREIRTILSLPMMEKTSFYFNELARKVNEKIRTLKAAMRE